MNNLDWNEFTQVISDYVGVDASEITKDTDVYDDLYLDSDDESLFDSLDIDDTSDED